MSDHPTTIWDAMQDGSVFYRKQQLYSIQGKLPTLSDYIIAGCRYGGPLALMRDSNRLIAMGRANAGPSKAQIQIYSPAGEGLLLFSWDQAKIIKFGWAHDELLVVLNEEGTYRLYDLQGEYQQFSLGSDAGEVGVIDAKFYEGGFVAMTGSLNLLEVKGWEGARPSTLASPGLNELPSSWAVIPPDISLSRHAQVLISVDTTILAVDTLESLDQRISRGPFTHVAPSPNGRSLALLTVTGMLWVVSADFTRSLAEFETGPEAGEGEKAKQVEWCGNDAILVTFDSVALLVGPFGDTLKYFYFGPTYAITEIDGVRVIGPDSCDLIQKVPQSCVSIFRPGSASPAAILFSAWEDFTNRSPKAYESIRSIRPDLAAAVDQCIDAAGGEWEPYWQRRLLSAAKFGWGFLDLYNTTDFVNMGQSLKVLNAVRFHEIGIPLTLLQYTHNSPSHLIARLTARNLHLLALRVSSYLSQKPDGVLRHWASAKIAQSKPFEGSGNEDEDVCRLIVDKFERLGGDGVSYADIAKRAWELGRVNLATMLLDHESRASDQVPLLLNMKEDRLALMKAVDSGDTDLVYHVLLHLHSRLPLGTFFRLLEEGGPRLEPASKLLQVYAREQDRDMLRDFYYAEDRRVESAVLALDEATQMQDPVAKITSVKAANKFFSEDKDSAFEAKMTDDYSRLLASQQQLEKEADGRISFFGLSVNDTIRTCLVNGMAKRADKLKSDFKVPDKRFWYVKLYALTSTRDFEGLDAFARSKRSPIGYEPFVHHLVSKGHLKEAASYVQKCDASKRVDLYVECSEWRMAGKECKDKGNKIKLDELRRKCPNSLIGRELDALAAGMK